MYEDIIQQAMAEMVAGYEKIIERYLEEKDFAVFNTEIKEESVRLGASIVKKVIEEINRMLRDSRERRAKGWYVVKDDRRTILTSLGNVCFETVCSTWHRENECQKTRLRRCSQRQWRRPTVKEEKPPAYWIV